MNQMIRENIRNPVTRANFSEKDVAGENWGLSVWAAIVGTMFDKRQSNHQFMERGLQSIAPFDLRRIDIGFGSIVSVGSEYMHRSPFERRPNG
jgi:hypothetical protein